MDILMLCLTILFAGIFILQIITLRQSLDRTRSNENHEFGSSKEYFQLKFRIDLIISVAVLLAGVAAFYGFDTKDKIQQTVQSKLTELSANINDTLEVFETRFEEYDVKFKEADQFWDSLDVKGSLTQEKTIELVSALRKYQNSLYSIKKDIEALKQVQYLSKNIYVVSDLEVPINTDSKEQMYSVVDFAELKTINGKPLPKFKSTPLVISRIENPGMVEMSTIYGVDKTSLNIYASPNVKMKYTLIIVYPVN